MPRLFLWLTFVLALIHSANAPAQEVPAEAERTALHFLQRLDAGTLDTDFYANFLTNRAKAALTESDFNATNAKLRSQLAGAASRRSLFASIPANRDPSGNLGTFFILRYSSEYPSGQVVQEVILEREDGTWKIVGFSTQLPDIRGR